MYNKYKGQIQDGKGVPGVGSDPGNGGGSPTGNIDCGDSALSGDIVSTALNFALDKPIPFNARPLKNKASDAKPAYITALDEYNKGANPADCGIFVGTVMIASGVDTNYPKVGTSIQIDYLKKTTNKYKIIDKPTQSDLQSGDILIFNNGATGHTMIYTGNDPYPAVDASKDTRVPSVRDSGSLSWMLKQSGLIAARVVK